MAVLAEEPEVGEVVVIVSQSASMCPGRAPRMAVLVGHAEEVTQGVVVGTAVGEDVPSSLWSLEPPVSAGQGSPMVQGRRLGTDADAGAGCPTPR